MSIIPRMYDFDSHLQMMERDFFRRRDDFLGFNTFNQLIPQEFAPQSYRPWDNTLRRWEDCFKPMEDLSRAMNQMILKESASVRSDDEKFQVNVDVQHFAPEEVTVKVLNGNVVVEGKHEEKMDQHGYVSRGFVRRYPLPQGCLPDTVESKLSSDGVLTITAPKVLPLPSPGEKIIPIQHTGPVKKQIGSPEPVKMPEEGANA